MALWGHQVHLCMCAICTYGVLCTKCLELAPPGLNSLKLYYIYIYSIYSWVLWVTCEKGWTIDEKWVQKGGSSFVARVQSWILKDVMPTAVLSSCQSN